MKIGNIVLPSRVRVAFAERPIRELLLGRLYIFNHFARLALVSPITASPEEDEPSEEQKETWYAESSG
jgi:hypothetical protein